MSLLPHVADVQITLNKEMGDGVLGFYVRFASDKNRLGGYEADRVQLNPTSGGVSLSTLAHELTHAATVQLIERKGFGNASVYGGTTLKRQQKVVQEITSMYNLALKVMPKDKAGYSDYGMSNVREFVAELYTNPNFRQRLDALLVEE